MLKEARKTQKGPAGQGRVTSFTMVVNVSSSRISFPVVVDSARMSLIKCDQLTWQRMGYVIHTYTGHENKVKSRWKKMSRISASRSLSDKGRPSRSRNKDGKAREIGNFSGIRVIEMELEMKPGSVKHSRVTSFVGAYGTNKKPLSRTKSTPFHQRANRRQGEGRPW